MEFGPSSFPEKFSSSSNHDPPAVLGVTPPGWQHPAEDGQSPIHGSHRPRSPPGFPSQSRRSWRSAALPRRCGERATPDHCLLRPCCSPGGLQEGPGRPYAPRAARSRRRFWGKARATLDTSHPRAEGNLRAPAPGPPSHSLPAQGRLPRRPDAGTNALQILVVFVKVYSPLQ